MYINYYDRSNYLINTHFIIKFLKLSNTFFCNLQERSEFQYLISGVEVPVLSTVQNYFYNLKYLQNFVTKCDLKFEIPNITRIP